MSTDVAALAERARQTGLRDVFMLMRPENEAALRCHRAAGFVEVDAQRTAAGNAGQPTAYTRMELVTPAYR